MFDIIFVMQYYTEGMTTIQKLVTSQNLYAECIRPKVSKIDTVKL